MNSYTIKPPPMRGIKQAVKEIKTKDPNTALTEKALRRLIITGTIPHVNIGRKYLVNLDILYQYLNEGVFSEQQSVSGIRRVKE